jgi:hypothetical protein
VLQAVQVGRATQRVVALQEGLAVQWKILLGKSELPATMVKMVRPVKAANQVPVETARI